MANVDLLLKAMDSAIWELGEAFTGMPDAELWKRPHPNLLSVGKLATHVAYWLAESFFGNTFKSPLASMSARYYTTNVGESFSLPMGSKEVYEEVKRIHEACKASFAANPHDSEEQNPFRGDWTWGVTLTYQAFHVAYHTGQVYSVRHLLGHETVDN